MRQLVRAMLWQFGSRAAVDAIFASARRAERAEYRGAWPFVLAGLVFTAGPPTVLLLSSYGWWLLTGRGPGQRLFRLDLGAAFYRSRRANAVVAATPTSAR